MTPQLRLLVVDDDEAQLRLVQRGLEPLRFEVRTTSSPIGVSNIVRDFLPDVLLIDVNQPALNGGQILSLVRKNTSSKAKLVLYSSADPERLRRIAMEVNADGWISKGLTSQELAKQLRKFCS